MDAFVGVCDTLSVLGLPESSGTVVDNHTFMLAKHLSQNAKLEYLPQILHCVVLNLGAL